MAQFTEEAFEVLNFQPIICNKAAWASEVVVTGTSGKLSVYIHLAIVPYLNRGST